MDDAVKLRLHRQHLRESKLEIEFHQARQFGV
jgi:hypothetical protein